jgi:hypothetical protein
MLRRTLCLLVLALLFVLAAPAIDADSHGDRVQFGRSIVVEENEQAGDVVCIGCSIHMLGTCGDLVAVGGSITIDGTVKGDAVVVGGGMHLNQNASVSGDLVTIGGGLSRHPSAVVKGDITSQSGTLVFLGLLLVPLVPVILIVALIVWLVQPPRPRTAVRA